MRMSYSKVDSYDSCKLKWYLRYISEVKTIKDDSPSNALYLGCALHRGIEKDVDDAIEEYLNNYNVITDEQINEIIKLEYLIPKVKAILPKGLHEEMIKDNDKFIGFIDLLVPKGNNHFDLYDFKYSNNVDNYLESKQLHIYKYYVEKTTNKTIDNMYYVFIPKIMIRQKQSEDLYEFRERLNKKLEESEIKIIEIKYDSNKIIEYFEIVQDIYNDIDKYKLDIHEYEKNISPYCKWCEFKELCEKGVDYMILPSIERRNIGANGKKKIWIYGNSFTGKTTMLDDAPNPLNLNTDGNIEMVTMPYIAIKDIVTVEGRVTKRKFAWEVLKETIDELEKKQNDFKTIIIDLVEDTREMCRLYMYNDLGIQHESDSGYGKGWDIIKTEYLSVMRRFFNLDYDNLVIVSHEIQSEVKRKSGQTITKIAPNIQESMANKLAGMVDIVARVVVEDDDTRTLNFKSNEFIFGGGRLKNIKETSIPLSWDELMKIYPNNKTESTDNKTKSTEQKVKKEKSEEMPVEEQKRTRRTRKSEQ